MKNENNISLTIILPIVIGISVLSTLITISAVNKEQRGTKMIEGFSRLCTEQGFSSGWRVYLPVGTSTGTFECDKELAKPKFYLKE